MLVRIVYFSNKFTKIKQTESDLFQNKLNPKVVCCNISHI